MELKLALWGQQGVRTGSTHLVLRPQELALEILDLVFDVVLLNLEKSEPALLQLQQGILVLGDRLHGLRILHFHIDRDRRAWISLRASLFKPSALERKSMPTRAKRTNAGFKPISS